MYLKINELIDFSAYCKKNNTFVPIDRFNILLSYLKSSKQNNKSDEINIIYLLLPTDNVQKIKLKKLIEEYFGFKIDSINNLYVNLDEYKNTKFENYFNEDLNIKFKELSLELINDLENIDFTRPVSNNFWLNQISQTKLYEDILTFFDLQINDSLDNLIHNENKRNFISELNYSLLEELTYLRNQNKDSYLPTELSPKEDLENKDFLYTDSNERAQLLSETKKLGVLLAQKFIKYTKNSSKGSLNFRKTIRKSLKTGGKFVDLTFKPNLKKKPKLILLCDVSGSMALYSLFGLSLLFGVVSRFSSVRAYVFIDGITDITKDLKKITYTNIKDILNDWNKFVHYDGHSDYQKSFEELLKDKKIVHSNFNNLLVIGDARNNYRSIKPEIINNLGKKFTNIYWMNPERKQYWSTGDSQFHLFQTISKKYAEVRNYNQLSDFIKNFELNKVIK